MAKEGPTTIRKTGGADDGRVLEMGSEMERSAECGRD
jgi:hypothetical protein